MTKIINFIAAIYMLYATKLECDKRLFMILCVSIILDYFTGIINSQIKGKSFDKNYALIGILKKMNYFVVLLVSLSFDLMIQHNTNFTNIVPVTTFVATWLIVNELISIITNITNKDIVPKKLTDYLKKIRGKLND